MTGEAGTFAAVDGTTRFSASQVSDDGKELVLIQIPFDAEPADLHGLEITLASGKTNESDGVVVCDGKYLMTQTGADEVRGVRAGFSVGKRRGLQIGQGFAHSIVLSENVVTTAPPAMPSEPGANAPTSDSARVPSGGDQARQKRSAEDSGEKKAKVRLR
jgi:hypothetical protein